MSALLPFEYINFISKINNIKQTKTKLMNLQQLGKLAASVYKPFLPGEKEEDFVMMVITLHQESINKSMWMAIDVGHIPPFDKIIPDRFGSAYFAWRADGKTYQEKEALQLQITERVKEIYPDLQFVFTEIKR